MTPVERWFRSLRRLALSAPARQDALHELRRRLRGEPPLPEGDLRRVLVLCHGNICRSPFAAALLQLRSPGIEVRSAGLQAGDRDPADPLAVKCARRFGVSLEGHRSQRVNDDLLTWAHLVLVMQGSQQVALERGWPRSGGRVRLLGDFLSSPPYLLMDPWGHPEDVFERVFGRLGSAVDRLAMRLQLAESGNDEMARRASVV